MLVEVQRHVDMYVCMSIEMCFFCVGKVLCGTACQQKIGPQVKYKQGRRQYGYVLGRDNVMWRLLAETEFRRIKKWSEVPFPVDEDNGS